MDSGKIPLKYLMTIRQGEPSFDNVTQRIAPAVTDIVRLKAASHTKSTCPFYEAKSTSCQIYDQRPAECTALNCRDATEIMAMYSSRRLTRRHLLSKVEGLWELVSDHQQHCDYGYIAELADKIRQQPANQDAQAALSELVRYDQSIRQLTLERSKIESGTLLFLYGRPLTLTIECFQLKLMMTAQGMFFEPVGSPHEQVCYRRDGFPNA